MKSKKALFTMIASACAAALFLLWALNPDVHFPWQNKGTVAISGNTPQAVKEAEFMRHGDPERRVDIVVGLKLRNEKELNDLLKAQADPTSPEFRKYLSTDEFTRRFAPTQSDYDNVIVFLKGQGLKVTHVATNRLIVGASGNIAQLERTFGVTINEYRFHGKVYISNDADPVIPARLKAVILSVIGLNTFAEFKPLNTGVRHHHQDVDPTNPGAQANPAGLSPGQVASVYDFPNQHNKSLNGPKYTGAGRTIAVASVYNYDQKDIDAYWKQYNVKRTGKVSNVYIGSPSKQNEGETTLDLQQTSSHAPGADVIMYLGEDPKFTTFTLVFNTIVTDNKADVMSVSWGLCEGWTGSAQMQTESAIFKQGASQGMAIFAAAGDDGAYDCRGLDPGKDDQGNPNVPPLQVDYPSSDPNVTAVGGTTLFLKKDGSRMLEMVWSGGGGGNSEEFDRPSWQSGPGVPAGDKRSTADVALVADPWTGYSIYFEGRWGVSGGTSFSAPVWAALWALGDEAAGTRIGSVNETVYRLGRSPEWNQTFWDVTQGDNGDGKGPGFPAGTAWDHPTGWGVPNGESLVDWLKKDAATK